LNDNEKGCFMKNVMDTFNITEENKKRILERAERKIKKFADKYPHLIDKITIKITSKDEKTPET